MALYKYPGCETGEEWTMKPGTLQGDSGEDIMEYWGLRPQYLLMGPLRIPQRFPSAGSLAQTCFTLLKLVEMRLA